MQARIQEYLEGLCYTVLAIAVLTIPSTLGAGVALLIIDVQNCFLPGGSLAVKDGEEVIPVINSIRAKYSDQFTVTVLTQDWHCPDHVSFASVYLGNNPYDVITLNYDSQGNLCNDTECDVRNRLNQTLWPVHCVHDTTSANFSDELTRTSDDVVVRKGYNCEVDSYSGFFDNGGFRHTKLNTVLTQHSIHTVLVVGLALDYCVYYTSKDAKHLGYETYLVLDASRPVAQTTANIALDDLRSKGVHIIQSSDLEDVFAAINAASAMEQLSVWRVLLCLIIPTYFQLTKQ